MTVHSVKISVSSNQESDPGTEPSPGPPDWTSSMLKNRVDQNVFNDLTERVSEDAREPSQKNTKSGTNFIEMTYRVDKSHSKTEILDKFENNVVIDGKWYRIEYHECDHDESDENRSGCSSGKIEREKGTVPEDV